MKQRLTDTAPAVGGEAETRGAGAAIGSFVQLTRVIALVTLL